MKEIGKNYKTYKKVFSIEKSDLIYLGKIRVKAPDYS